MPAQPSTDLALWQEHLDFLLPRKPTLRADEIAAAVGLDARTVERAFEGPQMDDKGRTVRPWLTGFAFNAAGGQRFARVRPRTFRPEARCAGAARPPGAGRRPRVPRWGLSWSMATLHRQAWRRRSTPGCRRSPGRTGR